MPQMQATACWGWTRQALKFPLFLLLEKMEVTYPRWRAWEGLSMDQNSSGNHEKGLGLWNPTYLVSISVLLLSSSVTFTSNKWSHSVLYFTGEFGEWRGLVRMCMKGLTHSGSSVASITLVSQLPVQCSCYSPTKQRPWAIPISPLGWRVRFPALLTNTDQHHPGFFKDNKEKKLDLYCAPNPWPQTLLPFLYLPCILGLLFLVRVSPAQC